MVEPALVRRLFGGLVLLLAAVALGAFAHAWRSGEAGGAHYVALALGVLFVLVFLTPATHRRTLYCGVRGDELWIHLSRGHLVVPLERLRRVEVRMVRRPGQPRPARVVTFEIQLGAEDRAGLGWRGAVDDPEWTCLDASTTGIAAAAVARFAREVVSLMR